MAKSPTDIEANRKGRVKPLIRDTLRDLSVKERFARRQAELAKPYKRAREQRTKPYYVED